MEKKELLAKHRVLRETMIIDGEEVEIINAGEHSISVKKGVATGVWSKKKQKLVSGWVTSHSTNDDFLYRRSKRSLM